MAGSVKTDMTTGRPLAESIPEKARDMQEEEKKQLLKQGSFLNALQDHPVETMVEIVEKRLMDCIRKLIKADPEAKAYLTILADYNYKFDAAKSAVNKLMKREI